MGFLLGMRSKYGGCDKGNLFQEQYFFILGKLHAEFNDNSNPYCDRKNTNLFYSDCN